MLKEKPPPTMPTKHSTEDLAFFGGQPLFSSVRPIGQLWLPDKEKFFSYSQEIYEQGRLTNNGVLVQNLEQRLKEIHQTNYCIAFANASIAIIALLKLIARETPGPDAGEVILPAFTYSGLPHLIRWAGFMPKFVDINEQTQAICPEATAAVISNHTAAILAVHQVNSPADINSFSALSEKHHVPVIYDSVHGVYCSFNNTPLGSFGEAEVFSLHATKLINGFEGGYITTNNKKLAEQLQLIRNFGYTSEDSTALIGLNGKLNEIHAALALASLDDKEQVLQNNQLRYEQYIDNFKGVPEVTWVNYAPQDTKGNTLTFNYEFFLLHIPDSWPLSRDEVVSLLRAENALARGYYDPPVHLSSHFPKELAVPSLPVTERLSRCFIQMPVGELLNDSDIATLRDWFCFLYKNGMNIKTKLQQ